MTKYTAEASPKGTVTMSSLGKNGRFANQLFQYAFLRFYARQHGLRVETPQWIGQSIFGFTDQPPSGAYREINEFTSHIETEQPIEDVDFWGYFNDTSYYARDSRFFRELFTPRQEYFDILGSYWSSLAKNTIVGLHLRYGDYGKGYFFETPRKWIIQWLERHWESLDNPLLFIASDERHAKRLFKRYAPVTYADIFAPMQIPNYYIDFWALSHTDTLLVANSTFSFCAALLNERASAFYRPSLPARAMIEFSPWKSPCVLRDTTPWLAFLDNHPRIYDFYSLIRRRLLFHTVFR